MTKPALHAWLSTPEAVRAAERSVKIPAQKMAGTAQVVGADELLSEAFAILAECAMPPRERGNVCAACSGPLDQVRAGAKFCGPKCRKLQAAHVMRGKSDALPAVPRGHVGSMWTWPEDQMISYAIREVGLALCNYLRTRTGRHEVPSSQWLEASSITAVSASEPDARGEVEDFLVMRGCGFSGAESFMELAEAALWLQGKQGSEAPEPVAA